MAINKQPPLSILPAYRPVAFELSIDVLTSASRAENANVTIYKNGTAINPNKPIPYKSSRNEVSPLSPLDTRYYFDVDIQKYCQDTLAPYTGVSSSPFVDPVTRGVSNVDMFGVYYITIDYEVVDLSIGLLEDSGLDQDASNEYSIFVASKENAEGMFLDEYYKTFASQDIRFLTKSSRSIDICKGENAYLSLIAPPDMPVFPNGIQSIRVILYDSSGNVLSVSVSALSFVVPPSTSLTVNTGTESLSSGFWLPLIPDFSNTALSYYTVELGEVDTLTSTFEPYTEVFTYKVKDSCCPEKDLRLHWLNMVGGVDSYTFTSAKDLQRTTISETGKKSLNWGTGSLTPHKVGSKGLFKYDSRTAEQYLISTGLLKNSEALWMGDLLDSVEVYAEIEGNLISCKVEDTTQGVTKNKGKIQYNLVLTLANERIIPRV